MPAPLSSDRSLATLRVVVWLLMGMLALAGLLLITVGVISTFESDGIREGLKLGADPVAPWLLRGLLVIGLFAIFLALRFFRELLAIIDTVGEGDPFAPANADRLENMGWLSLYLVGLGLVMTALAVSLRGMAPDVEIEVELSPGILVLTIVLFILARVFRHGAEMRRDLEGTV